MVFWLLFLAVVTVCSLSGIQGAEQLEGREMEKNFITPAFHKTTTKIMRSTNSITYDTM